jgi:hypothetical protein
MPLHSKMAGEEEASELILLPTKYGGFSINQQKSGHASIEDFQDAELATLFHGAEKYMEAGAEIV